MKFSTAYVSPYEPEGAYIVNAVLQFRNAFSHISVTLPVIVMLVNEVQPLNAPSPIVVSGAAENDIPPSNMQSLNASFPTVSSLSFTPILESDAQPMNTLSPSVVTLGPKSTYVTFVPANASSPM